MNKIKCLNVSKFLLLHPGGELAILTFAGKDATAEFDMIHPPDVVDKYAPDAVIGVLGKSGGGEKKAKKKKAAAGGAPVQVDKGDKVANHHAWGVDGSSNWRVEGFDDNPGVFIINVRAYFHAAWYLMIAILYEVCATIFTTKNFKCPSDKVDLTRSAMRLTFYIVVLAVADLRVFLGPDDFQQL